MVIEYQTESTIVDKTILAEAVQKLPDRQRVTIAMRMYGYTRDEIATVFGMTAPSIRFFEHQAVKSLVHTLSEAVDA